MREADVMESSASIEIRDAPAGAYADTTTANGYNNRGDHNNDADEDGLIPLKAAEAEAGSSFVARTITPTDETSSDAHSFATDTMNSDVGQQQQWEVIEYDPNDPEIIGMHATILEGVPSPSIEDNTPAAEALRANANVHVSRMGKGARAVNMQAVRRFVKRATLTTKSGVVKGKPPRLPPTRESMGERVKTTTEPYMPPIGEEAEDQESQQLQQQQQQQLGKQQPAQPSTTAQQPQQQRSPAQQPSSKVPHHPQPHDMEDVEDDLHHSEKVVAGTVEAGKKVLRAVDPHDMLKLLRWRRKRSGSGSEVQKSYVKGKVIDGQHELYTLSIAVMIGVRTSISRTNTILNAGQKRWVHLQDFRTTEKYEFRPKGGGATPPHRLAHTFKFKDYSPVVFAYLRRMYGVNEFDFLLSVCGNANFIEFISNAKSGQFFFYSSDGRYMIKTMTNAESKFLRRILPFYFRHCAENPNTLITRFFGMYRVKLYHLRRNVKFVIMNSVYYTDKYLQHFYDLKGSVVGRSAKPGQAVLKDNDLREGLPDSALALPPEMRKRVRAQLESDCNFLRDMGIMDYSLLVGVHHVPSLEDRSVAHIGFRGAKGGRRKSTCRGDESEGNLSELELPVLAHDSHAVHGPHSASARTDPHTHHGDGYDDIPGPTDPMKRATSDTVHSKRQSADAIGSFFFEDGLDDDDNSYLFGSDMRHDDGMPFLDEETEEKTQHTVERLYWPFHRMYDIHGHRRLIPASCPQCHEKGNCQCTDSDLVLKGLNIPKFERPLSDRKDGGFEMDTVGLHMPQTLQTPQGETHYDGKIFYFGIIDILQEYTSRKMVETKYRQLQTSGRLEASCVSPRDYGDRFLQFFDEFSKRDPEAEVGVEADLGGVKESGEFMATM